MRRIHVAFVLLAGLLTVNSAGEAAQLNRPADGTHVGWYKANIANGAWTDLTAASFSTLTSQSIPVGARFVSFTVRNRDTSHIVYVLLRAGGATAVENAFRLKAGESYMFPTYQIDEGSGTTTISLQGDTGGAEVDVTAWFVR